MGIFFDARGSGRIAEGVTETVFRCDIAQLSGSGLSLMPEGLETAITVEQIVTLQDVGCDSGTSFRYRPYSGLADLFFGSRILSLSLRRYFRLIEPIFRSPELTSFSNPGWFWLHVRAFRSQLR